MLCTYSKDAPNQFLLSESAHKCSKDAVIDFAFAKEMDIEIQEAPISPFDLQKADELFVTNVISGIQSISKYRKKDFENVLATKLYNANVAYGMNKAVLDSHKAEIIAALIKDRPNPDYYSSLSEFLAALKVEAMKYI